MSSLGVEANAAAVPAGSATRFWLRLGFVSFGGPAGQIAIMFHELVQRRRWISERRFLHALNYCMLLPGPEAQQLATYIGWLMHGTWGGIVAGVLFVLPSLVILIVLSWIFVAFGDLPLVAAIFFGIKPAVTAIVLHAAYRIGQRALKNVWLWVVAASAFVAIAVFAAPFPAIVVAAALVGVVGSRIWPAAFAVGRGHHLHADSRAPCLIDDDTPRPPHAHWSRSRFAVVVAAGCASWIAAMAGLALVAGGEGTLPQMAWFFSKAALVTFGGAYAVLPYVYQGAVEHFSWLTAAQMMAGLALGETTPGPLIMVVAFVGFVGAWTQQVLGDALFLAGIAGALVATMFTFLPSFVFIFAGAPLIESTRGDVRFTAPLAAITAAVVGVVVNLALFFARHVLWAQDGHGPFDPAAALIMAGAAIALFRFKAGVIPVIGACALGGAIWRLAIG